MTNTDRVEAVLNGMLRGEYNAPPDPTPDLETHASSSYYGIVLQEANTDRSDGAWLWCDETMEAEQ